MNYITTAIDYPNALPHIGTAFEKIGADVQARYLRWLGKNVCFLGGNDENTFKVVKRAKELNLDTQIYVDQTAQQFKNIWNILDISYDEFIQTSEQRHKIGVQKFIDVVYKAGFIYKKHYEGRYCQGCEEYKIDGVCENHPTEVVDRNEENYFFSLSSFKDFALDFITKLEIIPESRFNEIKNFINKDLQDISISRKNNGWGIPVPWDESQVIYVWFDALLSYLTGIGFGTDEEKFSRLWGNSSHFIGKDITRFHCVLFPSLIHAYNQGSNEKLKYPTKIFSHGFIIQKKSDEIVKISKSGNHIGPLSLIERYGSDAYRYYFLKCSFQDDSEYSLENFHKTYEADLSNALGNLIGRLSSFINKHFDGQIDIKGSFDIPDLSEFHESIKSCNYKYALDFIWAIIRRTNQKIDFVKPWDLVKVSKSECEKHLIEFSNDVKLTAYLLTPFLPKTSAKIDSLFEYKPNKIAINQSFFVDGKLPPFFPKFALQSEV